MRALIVSFAISFSVNAQGPYQFLKGQAAKSQASTSKDAQRKKIIGGIATFTLGNIGFFASPETTAKIAFSLFQTIGVIDIAQGIKSYYAPNQDAELYELATKVKKARRVDADRFSMEIIKIKAKEERAKRLATLYGSSFLAGQYLINSYVGSPPESLKNIYLFLTATNLMVAGDAYFSKSEYEEYYGNKFSLTPILPIKAGEVGLRISARF